MSNRPARTMRFYWRLMIGAQLLIAVCGLGELVLALLGIGWVQGLLGGILLVAGGLSALLRWRQYQKLTQEQLEQTIPENRRTRFQLRWPQEQARLKKDE